MRKTVGVVRWTRRAGVAVVVLVAAFAGGGGTAVAQTPLDGTGVSAPCGLDCPGLPSTAAATNARAEAPTLSAVEGVKRAVAGYYRFPGDPLGMSAIVGWVAPPGTLAGAPSEIQALKVAKDFAAEGQQATSTAVILGEGDVLVIPELAQTARTRHRRPVARAAADEYGCIDSYFCLYEHAGWSGIYRQWHPISNHQDWTWVGDAMDNKASSIRNRRDRDSWIAENYIGGTTLPTGFQICYDSHTASGTLGNEISDRTTLIYNSPGDGSC